MPFCNLTTEELNRLYDSYAEERREPVEDDEDLEHREWLDEQMHEIVGELQRRRR